MLIPVMPLFKADTNIDNSNNQSKYRIILDILKM